MTIKMRNCGGASVSIGDDREKPKMGVDWKTETIRQIFLEVLDDPRESEEKLTGIKLLFKYKKEEEISDTPLELVHVNMCGDIELDFHTINMDECLDDDDNRMKTQDCINSMIKVFEKNGYKIGEQKEIPIFDLLRSVAKEIDVDQTMYR